ncbi:MAG: hypothetical protein ABIH38_00165 [Patescibacteria group bacterium]
MKEIKKKIRFYIFQWLILWAPLFMFAVLPVITSWLNNRYQVTVFDLVLPVILSLILSLIIGAIFYRSFIRNNLAGLAGAATAVLFLGQKYNGLLFKFLDKWKDAYGGYFSLVFFLATIVICFLIYFLISKITKKWPFKTDVLVKAGIIVITVAFLLQFYSLVKVVVIEWPQFFYRPSSISEKLAVDPTGFKPDIYYIVLDRYANQNVMKSQFDFSNEDFIGFLKDNNFFVDPDAYSNYSSTATSIASTLNADYNSEIVRKFGAVSQQTVQPYHDSIHYASVTKQLKSLGYSYYHLGTWYEGTSVAPLADHYYQPEGQLTVFNRTYTLTDFTKKELIASIFWRLVRYGVNLGNYKILTYSSQSEIEATLSKISILNDIAEASSGGRFVFAHLLVPHDPFYFKPDGSLSLNPWIDNEGEPVKQKYVDQVGFVNNQMEDLITKIKENSQGQAVIILQSDEGPYPMHFTGEQFNLGVVNDELTTGDMRQWPDQDLKMKYGILAAYEVPKATKEDFAAAGDSVNIFRLVFNTYFGGNLPYLPKCYYANPDGRDKAFLYSNISERLTGQNDSACANDSR